MWRETALPKRQKSADVAQAWMDGWMDADVVSKIPTRATWCGVIMPQRTVGCKRYTISITGATHLSHHAPHIDFFRDSVDGFQGVLGFDLTTWLCPGFLYDASQRRGQAARPKSKSRPNMRERCEDWVSLCKGADEILGRSCHSKFGVLGFRESGLEG